MVDFRHDFKFVETMQGDPPMGWCNVCQTCGVQVYDMKIQPLCPDKLNKQLQDIKDMVEDSFDASGTMEDLYGLFGLG